MTDEERKRLAASFVANLSSLDDWDQSVAIDRIQDDALQKLVADMLAQLRKPKTS